MVPIPLQSPSTWHRCRAQILDAQLSCTVEPPALASQARHTTEHRRGRYHSDLCTFHCLFNACLDHCCTQHCTNQFHVTAQHTDWSCHYTAPTLFYFPCSRLPAPHHGHITSALPAAVWSHHVGLHSSLCARDLMTHHPDLSFSRVPAPAHPK